MSGKALLTVGSVLRGDDAAGPYLTKLLEQSHFKEWTLFDGGQMPEDFLSPLRKMKPDVLVIVDAASMNLEVGSVRRLTSEDVVTDYLMTTHSLPISFMLEELESFCGSLVFIGIQPGHMDFYGSLSPEVRTSVEMLYERFLRGDTDFEDIDFV